MYSKFDLTISDYFYNSVLNSHLEKGSSIYSSFEESSKQCLKSFIYDNGHIDGSSLKEHWFNIQEADIFISHSHKDITKVKAFAGWLYDEFGLTSFIDSCAWGYCDDLLQQIDDKECKKHDDIYNYHLRNYTTSHVHMMLSIALSEMIDKTECIMFYNSPNSVDLKSDLKTISNSKKHVTLSPWIYHELAMTQLIRRRELERGTLLEKAIEHRTSAEFNNVNIEHDIDSFLKEMISLTNTDLQVWKYKYDTLTHRIDGDRVPYTSGYENIYALDVLYSIKKVSDEPHTVPTIH